MTVPEYLTTFVAIIVSLAVADLLFSLHRLLRARARIRWNWLPPALAAYALLLAVNFWWGNYRHFVRITEISMAQFLPVLGSLVILFLLLAAVLPDEVPEEGLDLKAWYSANSRYIWILNVIGLGMLLTVFVATNVRTGPDVLQFLAEQAINIALFAGALLLVFSRRLWIHSAYVALAVAVLLYSSLTPDLTIH